MFLLLVLAFCNIAKLSEILTSGFLGCSSFYAPDLIPAALLYLITNLTINVKL